MEISKSFKSPAFTTSVPLSLSPTTSSSHEILRQERSTSLSSTRRRVGLVRNAVASPPPPTRPPPARRGLPGPAQPPSPCVRITGRESLQQVIMDASSNTPVIVFFHARWCRVCKTLSSKLANVASKYPQLLWYEVDFATFENKPLCKQLGVRLLPTFRLYWGGANDTQYEEDFTTGPFGSNRLIERLDLFFESNSEKLTS